ncbi:unnamed protein product [Musa hybrid cultivar]
MLAFNKSMKEPPSMKQTDKCLDSQLWHACAGGMVQMPAVNSKVYYFPQGHAEHAQGVVDFGTSRRIPPLILCRVTALKFMADQETDEIFAKIHMVPLSSNEPDHGEDDRLSLSINGLDAQEKPASFAKTLTQSDANNGGGFSVPRYCAETIFPRLDYSADPPVQTVHAKDVHGEIWKFRHIYRGTPRRHLLTTGWSTFVNQKKLVAGDSIVFLRTKDGDLCVGIRRAKRGGIGGGPEIPSGWNPLNGNYASNYGGFSAFLREEESKLMRGNGNGGSFSSGGGTRIGGRVRADSVIEAATLAAHGKPFEVMYYPRASTLEFCVKAASVKAAMRIQWCPAMRFKMAFETEDSSRISWFMGTISSVQIADPVRWPNSPWKLLQVTWDEPDLLQNVNCVNPWLVELVSNMPAIHLPPFSPPRKKLRIPQHSDFPLEGQLPTPMFPGNPLGYSTSPLCCFPDSTPAGIQGARHAQFGIPLSDLHLDKLQSGLFHAGFHRFGYPTSLSKISTGLIIDSPAIDNNISCLLTIGNTSQSTKNRCDGKPQQLVLFGKQILTEEQISLSNSGDMVSPGATANSSSDGNLEKTTNLSDGSGYVTNKNLVVDNSSRNGLQWCRDHLASELGLETGHCKVFMESDDVGRTLDLSVFASYEELYGTLADMFRIKRSEMTSHVIYKDATGAVKHTGDEPFSDFMKSARRLTILTDSGSDNTGRLTLPGSLDANLPCCS